MPELFHKGCHFPCEISPAGYIDVATPSVMLIGKKHLMIYFECSGCPQ
jgi:hypothetical protein